jgi:hypothetical protein
MDSAEQCFKGRALMSFLPGFAVNRADNQVIIAD